MTTFFLVRHARTVSNIENRYMGWLDEDIAEAESEAPHAIARVLVHAGIEAVYSSPLLRARRTACALADRLGVEICLDAAFAELRMGAWEGLTQEAVHTGFPAEWTIWRTDPASLIVPGRETLAQLQARVTAGLEKITGEGVARAAIFTHDTVIRVALLHVLGLPLSHYRRVEADNCSVNVLEYWEAKRAIRLPGLWPLVGS